LLEHSGEIGTPEQAKTCNQDEILIARSDLPPFSSSHLKELLDLSWKKQSQYKGSDSYRPQRIEFHRFDEISVEERDHRSSPATEWTGQLGQVSKWAEDWSIESQGGVTCNCSPRKCKSENESYARDYT